MQTPDVNVLVSAFRTDAPHHRLCRVSRSGTCWPRAERTGRIVGELLGALVLPGLGLAGIGLGRRRLW